MSNQSPCLFYLGHCVVQSNLTDRRRIVCRTTNISVSFAFVLFNPPKIAQSSFKLYQISSEYQISSRGDLPMGALRGGN